MILALGAMTPKINDRTKLMQLKCLLWVISGHWHLLV